jgi:hypothetical protein
MPAHPIFHSPVVGVWSRSDDKGDEESVIVDVSPSGGLTARGYAQMRAAGDGDGARVVASRSHALCGGSVLGWEVLTRHGTGIYARTSDEIFAVDERNAYRVEYDRESAFPSSPGAIASLRSFCPTRANVTRATVTRGAIVTPPSWHAFDVSSRYRGKSGSAILYLPPSGRNGGDTIMLFRNSSPDGVDPDVDADIKYALDVMTPGAYTILSKRGVTICDSGNDGWEVEARMPFRNRIFRTVVVFSFGSPYSYSAIYSHPESEKVNPIEIKTVESLCPGREAAKT